MLHITNLGGSLGDKSKNNYQEVMYIFFRVHSELGDVESWTEYREITETLAFS
jgi:hypothetical protein